MKKTVRKFLTALLTAMLLLTLGIMASAADYEWNKDSSSLDFAQDTQVKTVVIATYGESGKMLSARVASTDSGRVQLAEPAAGSTCEAFFLDENGAPALPSVPFRSLEDWDERYDDLSISESGEVSGGVYENVTVTDAVGDGEVTIVGMTINGDLFINGGGSNSIKLVDCVIFGKVIMAKASGEAPRLLLTSTPVAEVEVRTPAILEAANEDSFIAYVETAAALEIRGSSTAVECIAVSGDVESPVAITVTEAEVAVVEAMGKASIGGAGSVGEVLAEADVTVDSATVSQVFVGSAQTSVVVTVTGEESVEVTVDNENGAAIRSETAPIEISTNIESAPTVTLNDEPVTHIHRWSEGTFTVEPDCENDGWLYYVCVADGCGENTASKTVKVPAYGHDYGEWNYLNEQEHQRVCANDTTHVEEAFHEWDEGTTSATGETVYTCTECSGTKTESSSTTGKVAAAKGIISAQQMGFTLQLGMELPEDTTNIDYFALSLYDSTAPTESRMNGITCSVGHPYFYVNKAKFDPEYNYDTVEIISYALNGWEPAVWTNSINVTQGHYLRSVSAMDYDASNDPMPLLHLTLDIQSYAFYRVSIYDNGVEIPNEDGGYAWSDDMGSNIYHGCIDAEKAAIEAGTASVKLEGWQVYQAEQISGVWYIGFRAYNTMETAIDKPEGSEKQSLLPGIELVDGMKLKLTPTEDTSLIKNNQIKLSYDINNGQRSFTRNLGAKVVSTSFLSTYAMLNNGVNTVTMTVTVTPTDEAAAAGYVEESTSMTVTINYDAADVDYDLSLVTASFTDTDTAGKKRLTVTGLLPNQSYKVVAEVSSDGTTNEREFTTDASGTGVSEWYTDYAFDQCTISEWEVTMTAAGGDILCRNYNGIVKFTSDGESEEGSDTVSFECADGGWWLEYTTSAELPVIEGYESYYYLQFQRPDGSWYTPRNYSADEICEGAADFPYLDMEPGEYTKMRFSHYRTGDVWFTADIDLRIGEGTSSADCTFTETETGGHSIYVSDLDYAVGKNSIFAVSIMDEAGKIPVAYCDAIWAFETEMIVYSEYIALGNSYRVREWNDIVCSGNSCTATLLEGEWKLITFAGEESPAEPVFGTPVLKTDGTFMWLELTAENVEDISKLELWEQSTIISNGAINNAYMTQSAIKDQWELDGNTLKIYRVGYVMTTSTNQRYHIAVRDPASGVMSAYSTNGLVKGADSTEDVTVTAVKGMPASEDDYYTMTFTRADGQNFTKGNYHVYRPTTADYTTPSYMAADSAELKIKNSDSEILAVTEATVKKVVPAQNADGNIAVNLVSYNPVTFTDVVKASVSSAEGVGTVSAARGNPVSLTMTVPAGVTLRTTEPTVSCGMYNTVISDVTVSGNEISFTAVFNNLYATQSTTFYLAEGDTDLIYPLCSERLNVNYIELVGLNAQTTVTELNLSFHEAVTFYTADGTPFADTADETVHQQIAKKLVLYKNGTATDLTFNAGYTYGNRIFYFIYGGDGAVSENADYTLGFKDGVYFRSSSNPSKGYIGNIPVQYNGPVLNSATVNMSNGMLDFRIDAYDRVGAVVPAIDMSKLSFAFAPTGYWNREQYQTYFTGTYAPVEGGLPTEKGTYTIEKYVVENYSSGGYVYTRTFWNVTVKLTDADLVALQAKLDSYNGTDAICLVQHEGSTTASSAVESAVNLGISRVLTIDSKLSGMLSYKLVNGSGGAHSGTIRGNAVTDVSTTVFAQAIELTYNGVTVTVDYPESGVLTVTEAMFSA